MTAAADTIWAGLDRADWLEAFAAHPQIVGEPAISGLSLQNIVLRRGERHGDDVYAHGAGRDLARS